MALRKATTPGVSQAAPDSLKQASGLWGDGNNGGLQKSYRKGGKKKGQRYMCETCYTFGILSADVNVHKNMCPGAKVVKQI